MGRRGAVRRELCISGQPGEMALHRHHARGEAAERGGVTCRTTRGPHPEEPRSGVSKDGPQATWFETELTRLLTMRIEIGARPRKDADASLPRHEVKILASRQRSVGE